MMDRDRMLQWQAGQTEKTQSFQQEESKRNQKYRIIELILVCLTIGAILYAAFIQRSGQPTINIIVPTPVSVPMPTPTPGTIMEQKP